MVSLPPHIFGCVIYVHLHPHQSTKLEERALKCVFVGYGSTQKGYCAYHPPSKKFYISMDVTLNKHSFFYVDSTLQGGNESEVHNHDVSMFDIPDIKLFCKDKLSCEDHSVGSEPILNMETSLLDSTVSSDPNQLTQSSPQVRLDSSEVPTDPISDNTNVVETNQEIVSLDPTLDNTNLDETVHEIDPGLYETTNTPNIESTTVQYNLPPCSNRCQPPAKYEPDLQAKVKYPISKYVSSHRLSQSYASFVSQLSSIPIPSNIQKALADPRWTKAMVDEMAALEKNNTWDLVSLPRGKKTVGYKWVFTIKHKVDETIERYKARLVAKGYTQSYGVDYQETFAPVANLNIVRILLSLAANQDWPLL